MAPPTSLTASRVNLTPATSPLENTRNGKQLAQDNDNDDGDDVSMHDAPPPVTVENTIENNKSLKVALPDKFDGKRSELETFLCQIKVYLMFNEDKFKSTTE
jgi:hypothetical protein